jgi:ribosomal protein L16 Arg81 hydroxylase
LNDLTRFIDVPLKPGDFTYIPPNTGHRGMNVFVIVITLPGFKPHNELYLDADIKDRANGQSPFNPKSLLKKNYKNLDEFLK